MANWSAIAASAIPGEPVRHVCTSGTKIYYVQDEGANEGDVYEFDPDTVTETLIIDVSVVGIAEDGLTWFNDNLYILAEAAGPVLTVRRWTGSVNGLTTVKTFTLTGGTIGPTETGLMTDGSTLVAFTMDSITTGECWYSSDGSSWSAGSWSVAVFHPTDLNGNLIPLPQTSFPTGLFHEFVTAATQTTFPNDTTTEKSIFKFLAGVWTKIAVLNAVPQGVYKLSSPNEGIHWKYTNGAYFTDSTFTASSATSITPVTMYQVNMPFSVALDLNSEILYEYAGGVLWTALDTFSVSWDLSPTEKPCIVRLDNGDCFIVAYASAGAGYDTRIFARDEPIIEGNCTTNARFYYGIETPILTGELPFCRVEPGALAISAANIIAVLGTGEAAGQSVVYQLPPYNLPTWNNISGIVPTGTAVTSIKFV